MRSTQTRQGYTRLVRSTQIRQGYIRERVTIRSVFTLALILTVYVAEAVRLANSVIREIVRSSYSDTRLVHSSQMRQGYTRERVAFRSVFTSALILTVHFAEAVRLAISVIREMP